MTNVAARILILGSGGREHALARKLSSSPQQPHVYVAPGNDGIHLDQSILGGCIPLDLHDHDALVAFCRQQDVSLVVVGPELPLSLGLVDRFQREGLAIIGPTQEAARLESSKIFAKTIMGVARIPTAPWQAFTSHDRAVEVMREASYPCVLKADGLAAGKGTFIVHHAAQAEEVLSRLMVEREFGEAGERVLHEALLVGDELSYIVLTDGEHTKPFATSKDYKRLHDGERGPNTGGMGAISPAPGMTPERCALIHECIIVPLLRTMRERGSPYSGFLYVGVMWTAEGPHVLEFNVRPGDPETQALCWGMQADLYPPLRALSEGRLAHNGSDLSEGDPTVCIISASQGYPGEHTSGERIEGLARDRGDDVMLCFAGVRAQEGVLHTHGGRVLGVVARAKSPAQARLLACAGSDDITWTGMQRRADIGT